MTSSAAERGRLGAHLSWARTDDRAARTRPARQAFLARFEAQVDPDGVLSKEERAIRAEHALKAHMTRIRLARGDRATGAHATGCRPVSSQAKTEHNRAGRTGPTRARDDDR